MSICRERIQNLSCAGQWSQSEGTKKANISLKLMKSKETIYERLKWMQQRNWWRNLDPHNSRSNIRHDTEIRIGSNSDYTIYQFRDSWDWNIRKWAFVLGHEIQNTHTKTLVFIFTRALLTSLILINIFLE